jgi:DNA-binding IclR family transcriptional regulator
MPAGALERAVDLLERLGEEPGELTVADLASDAGMPTSTAYRLLAELERRGLVQRDADRTVSLGTRVVALGRRAEARLGERLVTPAGSVMAELGQSTGETVILTAPCGLEAIVLHVVETEQHPVRLTYASFRRAPMHRGASGKILAAYLEPGERERLLVTAGVPGLEAALDEIRRTGFVFTSNELDDGASAAAAPILDRRGRIAAGLSVAAPSERLADRVDAVTVAVRDAACALQQAFQARN